MMALVLGSLPVLSAQAEAFSLTQTFDDPTVTTADAFGNSVAIDGNNVLIGAPGDDTNGDNVGQAHLFDAVTGNLLQTFDDPTPSFDEFGFSVAIDGNNVLIGAPSDDTNGEGVGQAHLFTITTIDHYNAYEVRSEAVIGGGGKKMNELNIDVTLDDQFGTSVLTVKKAKLLLVPVDKNGEGIDDEATHLVCYELKNPAGGRGTQVDVAVVNQFNDLVGDQVLEVNKLKMLCVPSTKDVLP